MDNAVMAGPVTQASPTDVVISAARQLVSKMHEMETDADLRSVFGIAQAHGYKITSGLWHQKVNLLEAALRVYDASRLPPAQEKN